MGYPRLQRGLKSRHISLIALGGIIGSSYFLGTGYLLHEVGPCAFIAYILGGFISYLTLACLGEMAVASPAQGSFINSAAKYIPPSWACGVGWSYWFAWVIFVPSECIAGGLIIHNFIPDVPVYIWSILLGLIVSFINLVPVKAFGELEFWLALTKIGILLGFCAIAIVIFTESFHHEPIGTKYLLGNGGLFPFGIAVLLSNMVFLMSSFQGSEIIGLTASESKNPKKEIPSALRKMAYRIVGLYVIPTFLLVVIYPWQEAGLQGNIFSMALIKYGYTPFAHIFSFLIIAGTISTANSGLYATIRALLALSQKGMGPLMLTQINKQGVPVHATIATLIAMWGLLLVCCFVPAHQLYANLLATSGFTGTMCWISICWAELRFRKRLKENKAMLTYEVPFFPYITYFSIWVQVGTLLIVLFNPSLRSSFYFGVPALVVPMLWYKTFKAGLKRIKP